MTFRFSWKFSWNFVRKKTFLLSNTAWSLPCQTSRPGSEITAPNSISRCDLSKPKRKFGGQNGPSFPRIKSSVCDLPSNIFVATLANFQFEIKLFRIYLPVPVPPVDALSSMSLPPGVVGVGWSGGVLVDRWILWKKSRVAGWNQLEFHAPMKYKGY